MTSAIIKALADLRRHDPRLDLDRARVEAVLTTTLRELDQWTRMDPEAAALEATQASRLLTRAVRERRAALLERAFRLLGLLYSSKEMSDAYHGILSDERFVRARAIEFVDNVVDRHIASRLTELLERRGRPRSVDTEEVLEGLVTSDDAWLRAVAVAYAVTGPYRSPSNAAPAELDPRAGDGGRRGDRLRAALARCLDDPEPIVRDATRTRVERVAGP
jgi:hypothetical protein